MDSAVHTTSAEKTPIRSIDDGVNRSRGYISLHNVDHGPLHIRVDCMLPGGGSLNEGIKVTLALQKVAAVRSSV